MTQPTVALAADHGGVDLKKHLVGILEQKGYLVTDLGPFDTASVDYPDFADKVADAVAAGTSDFGILICGSGIGMSISANRNPKVRAALVQDRLAAELSRQHNDANVLCLGARLIGPLAAEDCVEGFLTTDFEGGRHERRVAKLSPRS